MNHEKLLVASARAHAKDAITYRALKELYRPQRIARAAAAAVALAGVPSRRGEA